MATHSHDLAVGGADRGFMGRHREWAQLSPFRPIFKLFMPDLSVRGIGPFCATCDCLRRRAVLAADDGGSAIEICRVQGGRFGNAGRVLAI